MSSASFATVEDITRLWRPLTTQEQERAEALLPILSSTLREIFYQSGVDIDEQIAERESFADTVKAVIVDVASRVLRQSTTGEAMSQESQGGMGYTWSGTYAIPGGGMVNAFMRNDLKRLGLRKQRLREVEMYDIGYNCLPYG